MTLVADRLEERIRLVPGVASVELDLPGRVRIRLLPEADPRTVMEGVRGVLGEWGLRTRAAPPRRKVEPVEPPPPPPSRPSPDEPRPGPAPSPGGPAILTSLGIEEEPGRVRVTAVASDGRRLIRVARPGRRGLEEAVLQAVAALVDPDGPVPGLISLEERRVEGHALVTVLLEGGDGVIRAGSAIVGTGWAFAFGRAVWQALAR